MSYTINLTNGNVFATIPDGTLNTSSSMVLIGKNYAGGYGQFLDDNFIHLLENGANSTPPGAPLTGQLWFNTTLGGLQVYNGSGFKALSALTSASSSPNNNIVGDLWYDTTNAQLNVWTGTGWLIIGPIYTAATGVTGAIPTTIADSSGNSHVAIELYVGGDVVGIVSKDATFTPQTTMTGFTTIGPGIQLSTTVGHQTPVFTGTATNSETLNNLTSSQFMRSDISTGTLGNLSVAGNIIGALSISATGNIEATKAYTTNGIVLNQTAPSSSQWTLNVTGGGHAVLALNGTVKAGATSTGVLFPDGTVQTTAAGSLIAGAVGTFGLMLVLAGSPATPGATYTGTELAWTDTLGAVGTSPAGIWQACGITTTVGSGASSVTLFQRIA